jgi:hypothetical protein
MICRFDSDFPSNCTQKSFYNIHPARAVRQWKCIQLRTGVRLCSDVIGEDHGRQRNSGCDNISL